MLLKDICLVRKDCSRRLTVSVKFCILLQGFFFHPFPLHDFSVIHLSLLIELLDSLDSFSKSFWMPTCVLVR